ncbi:hypothetical protein Tter_2081 [Thermobaculum terrenum ATCC BAA-798]|uniref:Uncharacterized protein n=1 Tax=Thermobaculum terrenum (strain ATCC BAA-798 / CCMEE 7001 / YNP1) TaxID=525904 RepID=D1CGW3_THET1|nr:hypothetical protein [Thermobaculum terrenum]ACZ42984.1 hypothetical protein Tter_2081 [Thermobaculum terrenum ATCC BAA-798]
MLRKAVGLLLLGTGVIACPCHLPLTLPLLVGLLGGTALGSLLTSNPLIIGLGALAYFVFAIAMGVKLLGSGGGERAAQSQEMDCCSAAPLSAESQQRQEVEDVVHK